MYICVWRQSRAVIGHMLCTLCMLNLCVTLGITQDKDFISDEDIMRHQPPLGYTE